MILGYQTRRDRQDAFREWLRERMIIGRLEQFDGKQDVVITQTLPIVDVHGEQLERSAQVWGTKAKFLTPGETEPSLSIIAPGAERDSFNTEWYRIYKHPFGTIRIVEGFTGRRNQGEEIISLTKTHARIELVGRRRRLAVIEFDPSDGHEFESDLQRHARVTSHERVFGTLQLATSFRKQLTDAHFAEERIANRRERDRQLEAQRTRQAQAAQLAEALREVMGLRMDDLYARLTTLTGIAEPGDTLDNAFATFVETIGPPLVQRDEPRRHQDSPSLDKMMTQFKLFGALPHLVLLRQSARNFLNAHYESSSDHLDLRQVQSSPLTFAVEPTEEGLASVLGALGTLVPNQVRVLDSDSIRTTLVEITAAELVIRLAFSKGYENWDNVRKHQSVIRLDREHTVSVVSDEIATAAADVEGLEHSRGEVTSELTISWTSIQAAAKQLISERASGANNIQQTETVDRGHPAMHDFA